MSRVAKQSSEHEAWGISHPFRCFKACAVWSIIQSSLFVRLQGTQVTEEENSDPGIAVGKQTDTLTIQ